MVIKGAVKRPAQPAVQPAQKVTKPNDKKERKSNRKLSAPIKDLDKIEVSIETEEEK